MYTRNSWGSTIKSQERSTLMNSFISTVTSDAWSDREQVSRQLQEMDKRLSRIHAPQYYDPTIITRQMQPNFSKARKLSLPKGNTLTDALIRNSLGCDEKYAKSYIELLDSTKEQTQKQQRIDQIKRKFSTSNKFADVFANTKPHSTVQAQHNFRPVVDNEHQGYLKTQLIFLEKPNNSKYSQKQYFDKHSDQVTKKIYQLGGMEDTIGKMERSLTQNQIKSAKRRQVLEDFSSSPKKNSYFMMKKSQTSSLVGQKNWLDRSRIMREGFKDKFRLA